MPSAGVRWFFGTLLVGGAVIVSQAHAAWTPNTGNPLLVPPLVSGTVAAPQSAPDGAGGVFVVWSDTRGQDADIWIQHLDADGNLVAGWPTNGLPVSTAPGDQINPKVISDGSGGALVCWQDKRGGTYWSVYMQHVSGTGCAGGWPAAGVAVSNSPRDATAPDMCTDMAGGAVVTWLDARDTYTRPFVQRILADGSRQWPGDKQLYGDLTVAVSAHIASDGASGGIVAFDVVNGYGVEAQRIKGDDGSAGFPGGPVSLSYLSNYANASVICPDPAGGAYIALNEFQGGAGTFDVYVNHVDNTGVSWGGQGVAAGAVAGSDQANPQITPDGLGGAIASWFDWRSAGAQPQIYVQRVIPAPNGATAPCWPVNGLQMVADNTQYKPAMALSSDGAGGAILAWSQGSAPNIFGRAVRLDAVLGAQTPLCIASGSQDLPTLVTAADGSAIAAWVDGRSGVNVELYANQMSFTTATAAGLTSVAIPLTGRVGLKVTWNGPADPVFGAPTSFELRRSSGPITETNFISATLVTEVPADAPGSDYCYVDTPLPSCATFYYAIRTTFSCGVVSLISNVPHATTDCTGYRLPLCEEFARGGPATEAAPSLPKVVELGAAVPNPAGSRIGVDFGIPADQKGSPYELAVYDVSGRRVRVVDQGVARPGRFSVEWDTTGEGHTVVEPGMYFLRLTVGSVRQSRSVMIVR